MKAVVSASLVAALGASWAFATSIPRITFAELTDNSDMILTGRIARTWTAWDSDHKYIWTHYELRVSGAHKGGAPALVEFAEPGGIAGGVGMSIAGTVGYTVGENVLVFLQRMPNGYLRTTGWGQGKYRVDADTRLHESLALREGSLEGLVLRDAITRVSARVSMGKAVKK